MTRLRRDSHPQDCAHAERTTKNPPPCEKRGFSGFKAESSGDIMQAKDQLGHTTVVMTENYIRKRIGKKVTPTK